MSKSYKKHPFCSVTKSGDKIGEKDDKQRSNRKIRRSNKKIAHEICIDLETSLEKNFFKKNELGGTDCWNFRKDGKQLLDTTHDYDSMYWTKNKKLKK